MGPPATLSRSCSDNSGGSAFLVSSLMVFLLFENVSFVNSGAPRKHPNQLPSPYKVQANEKRGHNSFPREQSIHEARPNNRLHAGLKMCPAPARLRAAGVSS